MVFYKNFLCNLSACKGVCCVDGDSGAPLTQEEYKLIEKNYPKFEKHLDTKYKKIIKEKGFAIVDIDGDLVTPLYNNKECVYTYIDKGGCTKCAIEKAFIEGESDFHKPLSCHLFPIRIEEYKNFDAVNYQKIDICKPGRKCGIDNKLPLYKFLKEPLIRKYGEEWYKELEIVAEELKNYTR